MFEDFVAAEVFFNKAGFVIDREALPDTSKLSALKYLLEYSSQEQLRKMQQVGKIRATWRLRVG